MSLRVIIVGAGTGGLCLAHGLRRAGIEVVVLERDDSPRALGLRGYRVGISPNGARSLRACLPPELYTVFEASTGEPYSRFLMCTERYHELVSIDVDDMPGGGVDEHNVSRTTLRQVLLTGIEDLVLWGRRYRDHRIGPDGSVTVYADGGDPITGDLLVGADGANSRVRGRFLPGAGHTSTGLLAVGGKAALDDRTSALVPSGDKAGMAMLLDRRGNFGISHVMRMRWDDDRVPRPGIAPEHDAALRGWSGLTSDPTTDFISWGVTTSQTRLPEGMPDRSDGRALLDLALRVTAGWDPRWSELLRRSDPESAISIDIRTSDPLPYWEPGPITLIGDAAHTMTPGRGAGANTALRDARELCERLVRVRDGERGLTAAVGDYEALMRRYSALAVEESLEFLNDDAAGRGRIAQAAVTAVQRTGLRVTNRLPGLRRRMARDMQKVRDSELV